jgi:Flp pilus assembly protein TadD
MLGNVFARDRKFDEAIDEFSRIPETDSSYCKAQSSIGMALLQKHQLDEAIIHFKISIDANPAYADAYNRLGAAVAELGRTDEAIQYFHKALELSPYHAFSYANLGAAYDEKGEEDEALMYYNRSLDLAIMQISRYGARAKDTAANIDCRIGDLLLKNGRVAEAVDRYLEALNLEPGYELATQRLNKLRDTPHVNGGTVR